MTYISRQNSSFSNDCRGEKKYTHKKLPSRRAFLVEKTSIDAPKYCLFDCGFLRGTDSKIRFFRNNIANELMISPVINGKFFDDPFSEHIKELMNWERLYIEVFDSKKYGYSKRYLVTRTSSDRVYIHSYDEQSKTQGNYIKRIQLDILNRYDYKEKEFTSSYPFGGSSSVKICGNNITAALSPSDYSSPIRTSLLWQIPIFYILNDAIVKSSEYVVEQLSVLNEDKCWLKRVFFNLVNFVFTVLGIRTKYDKWYNSFMYLKMNFIRSNPIEISTTLASEKTWSILAEHFKIKEIVDELCSLVTSEQNHRNEKIIRYFTYLTALTAFIAILSLISVLNDGLQLKDRFTGADAIKAIVSIFMPGSV